MKVTSFHAALAIALAWLPLSWAAFAFSINSTSPASCGSVKLGWTGGTAPFVLSIIPAYDYPQNVTIPSTAVSNGVGSYTWQVNYPSGTQLAIMMSDASGYGLLTVGQSSSNCQMRSTATDFLFYLNETSVNQCDPVQIYWDKTAVAPVTIIGVIPGGQPFVFTSSNGQSSLVWNTNIASGTSFILAAFDAGTVGNGGSSALMTVGGSSDSGCLDDSSPSSTPVSTPTASSTTTESGGGVIKTVTAIATVAPVSPADNKISTGGIAGIVLGAIIGFCVLQGLVFWFCCRRQLAALLSHRKEMRGREIKHDRDVDLVSQHRQSTINLDDPSVASPSRRTSALWSGGRGTGSGSAGVLGGRSIFSGDERDSHDHDQESAISPFWDPSTSDSPRTHGRPLSTGTFANSNSNSNSNSDFLPPTLPHLRTDSLSSMLSVPLFHDNGESDGLPYLATSTLGPSSPSTPSVDTTARYLNSPLTPAASASRLPARPTKAQMAASMSTTNPDRRSRDLEGPRQPRHEAPQGGFRFHEDAGRIEPLPAPPTPESHEVEDLPPTYRPEWETESQRGRPRH